MLRIKGAAGSEVIDPRCDRQWPKSDTRMVAPSFAMSSFVSLAHIEAGNHTRNNVLQESLSAGISKGACPGAAGLETRSRGRHFAKQVVKFVTDR